MPSELTHKSGFSFPKYLGLLVAAWIFGYVVGINQAASVDEPSTPESSHTIPSTSAP